ncbi:MAG: 1-acyl-sn-glycerol-3-phosphate acyltransferase, partial [Roseobacter sp.]
MNATWHGDAPPPMPPIGAMGWVGVLVKLPLLGIVVFGGLVLLLLVRLIERPLCGLNRPVTPHITVFVCRLSLGILGIV